jgi:hypothetical protein
MPADWWGEVLEFDRKHSAGLKTAERDPTLPKCIKCDGFALYRNQDGSVECLTCGPNASWRDYPFKRGSL